MTDYYSAVIGAIEHFLVYFLQECKFQSIGASIPELAVHLF